MKSCNEMVNSLMERLDAYEVRQKQKRKTVMRITSVACAFAVVAAVGVGLWQGGVFDTETPPVEEPSMGTVTENLEGIGGDSGNCKIHSDYYHAIIGNFNREDIEGYVEYSKDKNGVNGDCTEASCTIVDFVRWANITREEYIKSQGWKETELDEIVMDHCSGNVICPYTKRQFLDAIYGDDPELTAWVFAPLSSWPKNENK